MLKTIIPIVMLAAAGCQTASVPSTKLSFDPNTGTASLDSPKEITIKKLNATLPSGVTFLLEGYQSHNSAEILATVANANAQMADKMIQTMKLLESLAAQGALKGASGGLAP